MDLEQQIGLLLEKFSLKDQVFNTTEIKSVFDSEIYKRMQEEKGDERVIALIAFADGVSDQKRTFNNLIVKIFDLDTTTRLKTFLNGAAMSHSPNLEQMLGEFIAKLNKIWEKGIFIRKLNSKVYPYLHCMILDGQARPDYLMQSHHGAECFCNACLVKGKVVSKGRGHTRIFEHGTEAPIHRTHEMSSAVAEAKSLGLVRNKKPFDGIKDRTPLYDITYLDIVKQIPAFESMHTIFGGMVKRDYESMLSCSPNRCSLNKNQKALVQERMNKIQEFVNVPQNTQLKRDLSEFNKVAGWKTNQYADFFFYIGPIVFRDLVDNQIYAHQLVLIYLIGRLWIGISKEEIETLELLTDNYLNHHKQLYPITDQTSNLHSTTHLVETVLNLGPLKEYSGFCFEAMNGEVKDMITGPTNIIDQIAIRTEIDLMIIVKEGQNTAESEWACQGCPVNEFDQICFKSIKKANLVVRSEKSYVKLADGRFFKINKLFKERGQENIMCEGFEIVIEGNIKFQLASRLYSIEHILSGEINYQTVVFNAQSIEESVFFVPKFQQNSSSFISLSKGFVVRTIYQFHN